MSFQISVNPYTSAENGKVATHSAEQIAIFVQQAHAASSNWSKAGNLQNRVEKLKKLAQNLRANKNELATLITTEMGCPISQSISEVEKGAQIADFYAENAEKFLSDEIVEDKPGEKTMLKYQALGTLLHVAPYNYPVYLALRPVIPALIAGNTVLIKTPSSTPLVGQLLQKVFEDSGLGQGIAKVLHISAEQVESVIAMNEISLVTVVGSESAGSSVASIAGKHLKKTVMELGGSDPFIVFPGVNIDEVVAGAIISRVRNAGQSCNAAKRFIIHKDIAEEFTAKLKVEFEKQIMGDPLDPNVNLGPLANKKSLLKALEQIKSSMDMGANLVTGGTRFGELGNILAPTILTNVTQEMAVFQEETFAPIAPIIVFETVEEALAIANNSRYGLSGSVWTSDEAIANKFVEELEVGSVYVNAVVRGNIKLPFGGVKKSGYGREMSKAGIMEMVNVKSVLVKK